MAITRSEFENARKVVQEAITRHGHLTVALQVMSKDEADAIRKCMQQIADYFVQTRKEKQAQQAQQEQKDKGSR